MALIQVILTLLAKNKKTKKKKKENKSPTWFEQWKKKNPFLTEKMNHLLRDWDDGEQRMKSLQRETMQNCKIQVMEWGEQK